MTHPIRVRTSEGWQDLIVTGPAGPTGPEGPPGPTGSGAGNVNGPATAIIDDIAVYANTGGTAIKDGGKKVSDLVAKTGDTMTGALTAPAFIPNGSTIPVNGMYLPSANTVGIVANSVAGGLLVDSSGVGVGARFADSLFSINKGFPSQTTVYGFRFLSTIPATATSTAVMFQSVPSTAAATFTLGALTHYLAQMNVVGAGSTITTNTGFSVSNNMVGTTVFGFASAVAAGTNKWNFYASGTAANYMAGALGIGTTALTDRSLAVTKNMTGAVSVYGIVNNGVVQSDVTSTSAYYRSTLSTQAVSFAAGLIHHYHATQGTIGAGSTVTAQYGFTADATLIGATTNIGFRGDIPAGTNRYNFFASGTARNHMAGALSIGATTDPGTGGLHVEGAVNATGNIATSGSVSANSLAVNGASNLSGALTVSGDVTIYRFASPLTGYHYFGSGGTKSLGYNGTDYEMTGGNMRLTPAAGAVVNTWFCVAGGGPTAGVGASSTSINIFSNGAGSAGMYIALGSSSWVAISDARLDYKQTATPITVLDRIDGMYLYENIVNGRPELFVKAQEFNTVFPHMVYEGTGPEARNNDYVPSGMSDENVWGVSYERAGVAALQGLKELKQLVTELRAEIAALKGKA